MLDVYAFRDDTDSNFESTYPSGTKLQDQKWMFLYEDRFVRNGELSDIKVASYVEKGVGVIFAFIF